MRGGQGKDKEGCVLFTEQTVVPCIRSSLVRPPGETCGGAATATMTVTELSVVCVTVLSAGLRDG